MGKITISENRIVFQRRDELTVLEPYGLNCFRCRSTRNGRLSDENHTLLPSGDNSNCVIEGDESRAVLKNGQLKAVFEAGNKWYGGVVSYYRGDRLLLMTRFEGDYTNKNVHVEGDHYRIKTIFGANEGEHFYGLGHQQEDVFDRKGSTSSLEHYNTKSTVPVLYSSLGYGFFWNNPAPGRCETTNNHTMWVADSAYQSDYLIYTGESPAEIMKKYCELTGFPPEFPEWAAGFWQSKLRYESQADLLAVAREYKKRNIPISAIVADFFHWREQGEWKFDEKYWPDPAEMSRELHEMGIEPIVSVWPTTNPKSENYEDMNEANMLIRTENGQYGLFDFNGQQSFVDFTDPAAREYVWGKAKQNYYDKGIKSFWLDEAEPEVHPQQYSNLKLYAGNGAQSALLYPFYYTKAFYDGLKAAGEKAPILLVRAAFAGSQRVGALVWNGDIMSSFEALKCSVKSGLSLSMSGIPWWTTDIGGFLFGNAESESFRELIIRWTQFGLFSPVMRLHGLREKPSGQVDRYPEILEKSGGDNEIWSYGESAYGILKSLIELRERLRPYIMRNMKRASESGVPIARPLFFDYYDDEVCFTVDDEYMFGDEILFAPILKEGQTERTVYLPEGDWISTSSGEEHFGKTWITAHAELDCFIAYVKKGSRTIDCFRAGQ